MKKIDETMYLKLNKKKDMMVVSCKDEFYTLTLSQVKVLLSKTKEDSIVKKEESKGNLDVIFEGKEGRYRFRFVNYAACKNMEFMKDLQVRLQNKKKMKIVKTAAALVVTAGFSTLVSREFQIASSPVVSNVSYEEAKNEFNQEENLATHTMPTGFVSIYQESIQNEQFVSTLPIVYGSKADGKEVESAREAFGKVIYEIAEPVMGLDPELVIAQMAQESSGGTNLNNGYANSAYQIENSKLGETVTYYNFQTKAWEKIPITLENLQDARKSTMIACGLLQNCIYEFDYNPFKGLTAYNRGISGFRQIDGENWLQNRSSMKHGDSKYLEHVLRYFKNDSTFVQVPTGEKVIYGLDPSLKENVGKSL